MKVVGRVADALGVSIGVIADQMMYLVDPAAAIVKTLDSNDDDKNNGYLDVIWSKH